MAIQKSAVILLSRQNLRPSLKDEWVRKLNEAIQFVKANNLELISSVGSPNWEIITSCALLNDVSVKIVVPILAEQDEEKVVPELKKDFSLTGKQAAIEILKVQSSRKLFEPDLKRRDNEIVKRADLIIPISIRPNGNLQTLLQEMDNAGKNIHKQFSVNFRKNTENLSYTVDSNRLSDETKQIKDSHIFHWTRASNFHWPNETKFDYYKDILYNVGYPRSAFDTLERIASSKLIIGSAKNIQSGVKAVSFSGLSPADTIKLMRWRARYRQMSFEPYGIGIEKSAALEMGVKPVLYIEPNSKSPKEVYPYLTQSIGRMTDWRNEEEFRIKGDFDLSRIPSDNLVVVTYYKEESIVMQQKTGIRSVAFLE